MQLSRARVTNYRSIDDSGWVSLDNVACMVGKNESGKTAFLQALRRLNPVGGVGGTFDLRDYPRKGYVRYKRRHEDEPATVVQAEFELTEDEIEELENEFGQGVLRSSIVVASKNYKNQRNWSVDIDEGAVVRYVIASAELPHEVLQFVGEADSWETLQAQLDRIDIKPPSVQQLLAELPDRFGTDLRQQVIEEYLEGFLPTFVYFDNYSAMHGQMSIQDIKRRKFAGSEINDADRTFMSLLK
ncbi:MAG TPA: AAA family ATPase, partial [SAR202 cluster bacterium]|nr:AAA family ATPase [SAR202 cluster bacterium]